MSGPAGAGEVDALITDTYLESLLAARERRAWDAPSVAELDPGVRAAAARLADAVVRVHPSFRFEERLAARLAAAAAAMALPRAVGASASPGTSRGTGAGGGPGPGPGPTSLGGLDPRDPLGLLDPLDLDDPARPEESVGIPRRPLIIGGTLASAALSIAGAAIVAWRWNRAASGGQHRVRLV